MVDRLYIRRDDGQTADPELSIMWQAWAEGEADFSRMDGGGEADFVWSGHPSRGPVPFRFDARAGVSVEDVDRPTLGRMLEIAEALAALVLGEQGAIYSSVDDIDAEVRAPTRREPGPPAASTGNPFASPETEMAFDEDDRMIARYVMKRTWGFAASSLGLGALSWCCNPCLFFSLMAVFAGFTPLVRVREMAPELRAAVGGEAWLAVALGLVGAMFGAVPAFLSLAGF